MSGATRRTAPDSIRRGDAWLLAAPGGFVFAVAGMVCVLEVAALVELKPLRSDIVAAGMVVVFAITWLGFCFTPARRPVRLINGLPWLALSAPLVLLGYAVAGRFFKGRDWIEWFLGGDNVRHVVLVSDVLHDGNLSYADSPYPRGWHAVLATVWATRGSDLHEGNVALFVEGMALATWGLAALMALALATVTISLLCRLEIRGRVASWAVVLTGALTLTPRVLADYLALGFQTSLLGVLILAVAVQEALDDRRDRRSVLLAASCWIAMSHTWQPLLPPIGIWATLAAVGFARGGSRRRLPFVLVTMSCALLASAPSVISLVINVDPTVVEAPGVAPPVPWAMLVLGCLAGFAFLRAESGRFMIGVFLVSLSPAATAGAAVVLTDARFTDYYPTKLLWTTVVLLIPLFTIVAARVLDRMCRIESLQEPLSVCAMSIVALVALFGAAMPAGALLGAWSTVDARRVLSAIETAGASRANAVWMSTGTETAVTRTLLYVYRPERPGGAAPDRLSVNEECESLAKNGRIVVVSTRRINAVHDRYGCATSVTVLQVLP